MLFIPEFDISEYQSNFGWAVIIVSPKTITRMHSSRIGTAHLHILRLGGFVMPWPGRGFRVVVDL